MKEIRFRLCNEAKNSFSVESEITGEAISIAEMIYLYHAIGIGLLESGVHSDELQSVLFESERIFYESQEKMHESIKIPDRIYMIEVKDYELSLHSVSNMHVQVQDEKEIKENLTADLLNMLMFAKTALKQLGVKDNLIYQAVQDAEKVYSIDSSLIGVLANLR